MNRGWIVWIVLIAIVAIVAYVYTGFNFHLGSATTTSSSFVTTSVSGTIAPTTSITTYLLNCSAVFIKGVNPYSSSNETCQWQGGELGVWVNAGDASNGTIKIVGSDGITYLYGGFDYNITTFYSNVTLPAQNYTVTLAVSSETGTAGEPFAKLNTTTTPPPIVYPFIYNANFSDGEYTGWAESGSGFGTAPLNITYANDNGCYYGTPWTNYPGSFFATTFTCGTSVSPGNLTSEEFRVNPQTPFLNFKMVSPDDSLIYVEILRVNEANETPAVTAYFNTYNITLNSNSSSTFENVSVPLTTLTNKVVRIRIVASTLEKQRYVAVGDFQLGSLPENQPGVYSQINITR